MIDDSIFIFLGLATTILIGLLAFWLILRTGKKEEMK
jgi:hypothetical protein